MAHQASNLGLVTVWLRQDDTKPDVYSARFRVEGGRGWLKWPSSVSDGIPLAAPTGTAGGLHLEDALGLVVQFKLSGARTWREVKVFSAGLPTKVRRDLGRWVQLSLTAERLGDEPTDMASMPLPEVVTDVAAARLVSVQVEEDDADILEPSDTLPGSTPARARGGGALVRSLVVRIRQQEAEIASLRKQLEELKAAR